MADAPVPTAVCRFCAESVPVTAGRQHGQQFRCTPCSNAERMIRRNVGGGAEIGQWTEADTHTFFKKIKLEGKGGQLAWTVVRAALVTRMAERRIQTFTQEVEVEMLPKSVLLVRGWEEPTLAAFEQEWSEAYQCDVYKVPVRRMRWQEAFERAEEQLLEHERLCTQKRSKGQGKGGTERRGLRAAWRRRKPRRCGMRTSKWASRQPRPWAP